MKKVLLVGLGHSAQAAQAYFEKEGYQIFTFDDRKKADYNLTRLKNELPLFDLAMISPGIRYNSAVLELVRILSLEVTGELALSLRLCAHRLITIAVTGSNGKTSTVIFLKEMLTRLGYKVLTAGNIGITLIDKLDQLSSYDVLLLEISSYQAEFIDRADFDLLIITSISPNHLDSYHSQAEYYGAKKRLILQAHNVLVPKRVCRSLQLDRNSCHILEELGIGPLSTSMAHQDYLLALGGLKLLGHDPASLKDFPYADFLPVSRYQKFFQRESVFFIDDSKATSLAATEAALRAEKIKTVLILGGHLKSDFKGKLSAERILIFGPESSRFAAYVDNYCRYDDLDQLLADLWSWIDYKTPCRVLFSPGGSSLQFSDYRARGEYFKKKVREQHGSQD